MGNSGLPGAGATDIRPADRRDHREGRAACAGNGATVNEPGIKLTTYFSERDRSGDRFLADALFDLYEGHEIHTSVLLRGVEGFGQHGQHQTDRLLTLSENLPAVSIAIDTRERIERALPDVLRVTNHG